MTPLRNHDEVVKDCEVTVVAGEAHSLLLDGMPKMNGVPGARARDLQGDLDVMARVPQQLRQKRGRHVIIQVQPHAPRIRASSSPESTRVLPVFPYSGSLTPIASMRFSSPRWSLAISGGFDRQ